MMPPASNSNQNPLPATSQPKESANSPIASTVGANGAKLAHLMRMTDESPDLVMSQILEYLVSPGNEHLHAVSERSNRNKTIAEKLISSIAVSQEDFPDFLKKYQSGHFDHLTDVTLPQQINNHDLHAFLAAAPSAAFPLTRLNLEGCTRLTTIPPLPAGLQSLDASSCYNLRSIAPELPQSLATLDLTDCYLISHLPPLPQGLEELHLEGLEALHTLPTPLPSQLNILNVAHCISLQALPADLPEGLAVLTVTGCHQLNTADDAMPAALIINR